MRRFAIAVVGAGSLAFAGQALAQETDDSTFNVTAETQQAIAVACTDLDFGTFAVTPNNALTTVALGQAPSTADVVELVAGTAASCVVTGEDGGDATASLSGATGTQNGNGDDWDDLQLTGTDITALTADLVLSNSGPIANETITVGGTLTIPSINPDTAGEGFGAVSSTITLTVTD